MNNKKINQHLKKSLHQAPIDLLDKIKNMPVDKMQEHDHVTRQEPTGKANSYGKPFAVLGSFAAILMAIFVGSYFQNASVDSVIYFDINPSLEISVDSDERVISMQNLNQEAAPFVEKIDYEGRDLHQVIKEILDILIVEDYSVSRHQAMLISVKNSDLQLSQNQSIRLSDLIHGHLKEKNINPVVMRQSITQSNTIEKYAATYDLSIGKMTFIRNLMILNPEFEVEELVGLSLEELVKLSAESRLDIKSIIEADENFDELYRQNVQQKEIEDRNDEQTHSQDYEESQPLIGREKALNIAFKLIGGKGTVEEFEVEEDDGRYVYEIEIIRNGNEYEIEMDAHTGKVLAFEAGEDEDEDKDKQRNIGSKDLIGREKALNIAFELIGGNGTVEEFEVEEDDGRYVYEVEIIRNGNEYEIEMDAHTGQVLAFEADEDEDEDKQRNIESKDLIGREKALNIAFERIGGKGTVEEFEVEEDDGRYVYEIEIIRNGNEYDIEMDAHTGKVLAFEADEDEDD